MQRIIRAKIYWGLLIIGLSSKAQHNQSQFVPAEDTPPTSLHLQDHTHQTTDEISLPPVEQPYSPPGLAEEEGTTSRVTPNDANLESHDYSGDHVTNEMSDAYQIQQQNQDVHNINFASSADIGSHGNPTHKVHQLSAQVSDSQGGEPFNQPNLPESRPVMNNTKTTETSQSHATDSTCVNQAAGVDPVTRAPQKPTALSTFKRHMCETYSSDDDDVFLPNPPSKSQADKCIVSMAAEGEETGEDVGEMSTGKTPPVIVVTNEEGEGVSVGDQEEEDDGGTKQTPPPAAVGVVSENEMGKCVIVASINHIISRVKSGWVEFLRLKWLSL